MKMLGCEDEQKTRQTYENQRRLADISARITGQRYVVYRDGRGLYHICTYEEWRDSLGTPVEVVPQCR